jgi:hypothetical protein
MNVTFRRCWRGLAGSTKTILLKTEEPTSWRPWAEANRDMIHARCGAVLPTHTHTHAHAHTQYVLCKCTTVSGWQSVNRVGLHRVCTILRRFVWNPVLLGCDTSPCTRLPTFRMNVVTFILNGLQMRELRNPFRILDMNGWMRLLGYTASYSRKPEFSGLCNNRLVQASAVMYFLSADRK